MPTLHNLPNSPLLLINSSCLIPANHLPHTDDLSALHPRSGSHRPLCLLLLSLSSCLSFAALWWLQVLLVTDSLFRGLARRCPSLCISTALLKVVCFGGLCQASGIHTSCSISPHWRPKLLLSCMIIHTVLPRALSNQCCKEVWADGGTKRTRQL